MTFNATRDEIFDGVGIGYEGTGQAGSAMFDNPGGGVGVGSMKCGISLSIRLTGTVGNTWITGIWLWGGSASGPSVAAGEGVGVGVGADVRGRTGEGVGVGVGAGVHGGTGEGVGMGVETGLHRGIGEGVGYGVTGP